MVHEKAPTQRSHEPTPPSLLSSRKSIPIPGLHARVQRESRTKVCLYNEGVDYIIKYLFCYNIQLLDISDMPPTAERKEEVR